MTTGTQGGVPVGHLPWADLRLPPWGGNPKQRNFKTDAAGYLVQVSPLGLTPPRSEVSFHDRAGSTLGPSSLAGRSTRNRTRLTEIKDDVSGRSRNQATRGCRLDPLVRTTATTSVGNVKDHSQRWQSRRSGSTESGVAIRMRPARGRLAVAG